MTGDDGVWSALSRATRDPAMSPLRASDADRDVVDRMLAHPPGRIDRAELGTRTAQTRSAPVLGSFPWPAFVTLAALLDLGNLQADRGSPVDKHRRRLGRRARKRFEEGSSEPEQGRQ